MKVPIANNLCYEPTSVLDLQPSPSSPGGATKFITPPRSDTANNNHHPPYNTVDLDNLEGWESILSELGFNDDYNTNNSKLLLSQISPSEFLSSQTFDHTQPTIDFPIEYPNFVPFELHETTNVNTSFGLDYIDDLISAAQAFESNDSQQVQLILARLNELLKSPSGKPLQRAAFYFKEALQHLINTTTNNSSPAAPSSVQLTSYELVQTIRADKAFSGISPVPLFSTFTANQAILEAVVDGSPFIHIIDFDIGFGGHWASFMRELVDKASDQANVSTSMLLRITAIVPEGFGNERNLVKDNLTQFAQDLNLNFNIEFVLISTFETLSFKSVQFIKGENLVVHLSAGVLNHFSNNSRTGISNFLGDIQGVSPSCVVVVDKEVGVDAGTLSFGASFLAGIEFYTGLMESIEVAAASGFTDGGECLRLIETFVLRPRIVSLVEAAASVPAGRQMTWREAFAEAGMRAVRFSQFADFQADCLLRRAQVGGFHVAKHHGEMMLCWHDRPLVATSAWHC